MCKGKGMEKGVPEPASTTEQTKTFRSTNKAHGKLTGVNLVFYSDVTIEYRQYLQG